MSKLAADLHPKPLAHREGGLAAKLGRGEGGAAGKEAPGVGGKGVVAAGERVLDRGGGVAFEQPQRALGVLQLSRQFGQVAVVRAAARPGELDRQRVPIQRAHDAERGVTLARRKGGGVRPAECLGEELQRIALGEDIQRATAVRGTAAGASGGAR